MIGTAMIWLSLIWLPILMYMMLRNETRFKKNIAVGVTLPFEGRQHPDVLARLEQFKKQELLVCMALMVSGIPGIFLKFSLSTTLWFIWITACVVVPYIPYILCNRDLKRIKVENGWKRPNAGDTVTVDLAALPEDNWLSPWAFAPALVISLLPILFDRSFALMYLVDTALIGMFWLGYRYLFRNKAEIVDGDTSVTAALTRIRRNQWGKMWLLCAYSMGAMSWVAWLTMYSPIAMTVGFVVFMAALVGGAMHIEFQTRRLQERLTADSGRDFYVDDDDKWLGGPVYYNPNDSRLIINDRVGTNSSVNLAKPAGKALYAVLALLLVTMPLWGLLLGNGEIKTELKGDSLFIKGGMHEYTVAIDRVTDAELLTELPAITRTAGTGMPEFLGGSFASREYGKLKVCLNPTVGPWIYFRADNKAYLIGTHDPDQTQALYNALTVEDTK